MKRGFLLAIALLLAASAYPQTVVQQSVSPGGNNNFIGTNNFGSINGVINAGACALSPSPAWCTGSDWVGWVQAAYTQLPLGGGDIYMPVGNFSSSATSGVHFDTNGKPARLQCPSSGSTLLTFSNASLTNGFVFNYGSGNLTGGGIEGCQLTGPGSATSSVAIFLGGSPGISQIVFRDLRVSGFGIAESLGNNAFIIDHQDVDFLGNGTGFSALVGVTNSGESIHFEHSTIAGLSGTSSVCLAITAPLNNFVFDGGSLDQCTWNVTAGQDTISKTHFENPQATMSTPLFVNNGARMVIENSDFQWDFVGAPTPSTTLSCTAGVLIAHGNTFSSISTTLNSDIDDSGTCELHEAFTKNSGNISNFLNYTSSGLLSTGANVWSNNFFNGGLRATGPLTDAGASCTNGELALSAGWGTSPTVTAVVGLGQTCEWTITAGGASTTANPTITDTIVAGQGLPSASVACDMRQVGGTGAATLIDQTTLSATAPIFTFNGTPTASATYKVVRRCGP